MKILWKAVVTVAWAGLAIIFIATSNITVDQHPVISWPLIGFIHACFWYMAKAISIKFAWATEKDFVLSSANGNDCPIIPLIFIAGPMGIGLPLIGGIFFLIGILPIIIIRAISTAIGRGVLKSKFFEKIEGKK